MFVWLLIHNVGLLPLQYHDEVNFLVSMFGFSLINHSIGGNIAIYALAYHISMILVIHYYTGPRWLLIC